MQDSIVTRVGTMSHLQHFHSMCHVKRRRQLQLLLVIKPCYQFHAYAWRCAATADTPSAKGMHWCSQATGPPGLDNHTAHRGSCAPEGRPGGTGQLPRRLAATCAVAMSADNARLLPDALPPSGSGIDR